MYTLARFSKILIYAFAYLSALGTTISQCPTFINTEFQWQIDEFPINYPNCKNLPGSVNLWGEITDLSGLASLETIEGSFKISNANNIVSLSGLENLRSVRSINLENTPNLTDLSSIKNLEEFYGLTITETGIGEIPSFDKLVSDSLDFYVGQNPNLMSISLPSYSKGNRIWIFSNPSLTSISEINALSSVSSFSISGNENLKSISGFSQLEATTEFRISLNSNLTTLPPFPNLKKVNDVSGFFGSLEITANPSISNISGFEKLEEVTDIVIEENGLEGISGFDQLKMVKNNFIINNEPNLTFIPSFLQLEKAHYLEIVATNIGSIIGFSNLDTVTTTLSIRSNPQLSIIDGFENLKHTNFLSLHSNPLLADCNAFCPYRKKKGEDFSAFISQNALGCNSAEEFENDCIDTIGEILVYDIILNVFNGAHSVERLENLTVEIHKDDQLLKTYLSDENGFIGVNLKELEEKSLYDLVSYVGNDINTKLIYNNISYEELSQDFFEIEFPHRLLDSLDAYQQRLDKRMITANYFGGAIPINYNSDAYNVEGIEQVRIFWSEISENHKDEVEEIKRLAYGLYMMNLYLDDAIRYTELTAKAGIESLFNAYKLLRELNGLQSVVNKFKEQYGEKAFRKAMDQSMLAQRKMVYYITKKMFVNPYLASFADDPSSKQFVAAFKVALTAIEDKIFDSNALTENIFQEIVYLAVAQSLLENYYIPSTNSNLTTIEFEHSNIENDFQELVQQANEIQSQSNIDNINFEANADFYSGYAMDINELAGYIENLGLTVAIVSGGTLAPMSIAVHEFAQGLKLGTLALNGINFFSYSYRLVGLGNELDQITSAYLLSPNYQSAIYSEELLNQLLTELENKSVEAHNDLLLWKDMLLQDDIIAFAEMYDTISKFLEHKVSLSLNNVYTIIQNMGSELNATGLPDGSYIAVMEEYRKFEIQRYMMDVEMMALLFDIESEEIKVDFLNEIDTMAKYLDQIGGHVKAFLEDNKTGEYPPLIVVADYSYPDTLSLSSFKSKVLISNLGPEVTNAFNIILEANANCSINLLESQTQNLVLQSGESIQLEIEITPTDKNAQSAVFVKFENVRGINESLVYNFLDQDLFGNFSSSINEVNLDQEDIVLSPNPVQNTLFLENSLSGSDFKILNINGQVVNTGKVLGNSIDVSNLDRGAFFLYLKMPEKWAVSTFSKL